MARKPGNTIFPCGVDFSVVPMLFRLHDWGGKTLGYSKNGQDAHLFVKLMNARFLGDVAHACGQFFYKPLSVALDASGRRYEVKDAFGDVLCTVDRRDVAEYIITSVNATQEPLSSNQ